MFDVFGGVRGRGDWAEGFDRGEGKRIFRMGNAEWEGAAMAPAVAVAGALSKERQGANS